MKKIFTLFAMGILCLNANTSNAQVTINFDSGMPAGSCYTGTNIIFDDAQGNTNSTLALSSRGATSASFTTPFINIPEGGTVSFGHTANINKTGLVTIRISTVNASGATTLISTMSPVKTHNFPVYTSAPVTAGTYKILIEIISTSTGEYADIDNLSISGSLAANSCNTAPDAVDDAYSGVLWTDAVTGNMKSNDTDPQNDATTVVSVTQPAEGVVTFDVDGTFTFTPAEGFTGGDVVIPYTISDNASPALTDAATITISYPVTAAPLPVRLTGFSGNLNNDKVQLRWSVEENETGKYFQVQRSTDGKNFTSAGMMFNSSKAGAESYVFEENLPFADGAYYRLQIVNKDNSVTYSKIISLKGKAGAESKITVLQNPIKGNTVQVSLTAAKEELNTIILYNTAGVQVFAKQVTTQKGLNTISLNIDTDLSAGTYILESRTASTRIVTRIVK